MSFQTQVTYRNMESSDALTARISEHAAKLEQFYDGIIRCDVLVEIPHRHKEHGRLFHVRVHLHLKGAGELIVSRDPGIEDTHEDPYLAVRDAFVTARRQLQTQVDRMRGEVKTREVPEVAEREPPTTA